MRTKKDIDHDETIKGGPDYEVILPGTIALSGVVAFVVLWLLMSCGPTLDVFDSVQQKALDGIGCEPATTKCLGPQLLTCQADHTWGAGPNCAIYVPARACYSVDGKPGCYRVEEQGDVERTQTN